MIKKGGNKMFMAMVIIALVIDVLGVMTGHNSGME